MFFIVNAEEESKNDFREATRKTIKTVVKSVKEAQEIYEYCPQQKEVFREGSSRIFP